MEIHRHHIQNTGSGCIVNELDDTKDVVLMQ